MNQHPPKHGFRFLRARLSLIALSALLFPSCNKDDDSNNPDPDPGYIYQYPADHATGVEPLSGMLPRENIVMKSIIQVDLNRHVARLPLFKGRFNGQRVWFVRLDVSEEGLANNLGLNFAPRLRNADINCQTCIDDVTSTDTIPGRAEVNFSGTVDFSAMQAVVPGPMGFPPTSVTPGGTGTALYSDLIRVQGSQAVYNAPIIATGTGPFNVTGAHTNTHDRVVAIDTVAMTVDMHFVRAFALGRDIFYFSIAATSPEAAAIERAQFVPAMANIPAAGQVDDPNTARSDIFSFANGKRGLDNQNVQGLSHVLLDNAPGQLGDDNPGLYETLRKFGDARNVLGKFTTLADMAERRLYTPLWDLHIGKWTDSVVNAGINFSQNDANTIVQLARRGYITGPDGTPLKSTGVIINCPIIGFARSAPTEDQAPEP